MKRGAVTYGEGEIGEDGRALAFLEWTDDDRLVRRMGPTPRGAEFWSIALSDIARVGGIGMTLRLVPKDGHGETQVLHFADRKRQPSVNPEGDFGLAQWEDESDAGTWEAELRGAGVPSRYRAAGTVLWMSVAIALGAVVVAGVVIALAFPELIAR